jgi:hypothetical protein
MKLDTQHNGRALLRFMLTVIYVTYKPFMLSVVMLDVVMLIVVLPEKKEKLKTTKKHYFSVASKLRPVLSNFFTIVIYLIV